MKKKSSLTVCWSIAVALFLSAFLWWLNNLRSVDPRASQKTVFVIEKGDSVARIVARLKEENLIRNPFCFKVFLFLSGKANSLQAGRHYLSAAMTPQDVLKTLSRGTNDQWVTLVDGWRQEQVGQFLIKQGFAINPRDWQEETENSNLEGRLFPDTYLFPKGATQGAILKIIGRNFERKIKVGLAEEIKKSNLSLDEILILASVVEREAGREEDRRLVAGILLKRRRLNWPLQADASVQYAVADKKCKLTYDVNCEWWPTKLTKSDLQIKSPYNTYLYRTIPPGPICNPGLSSIKAVLDPKDSPYWFYLSDKEGIIHYARTDNEQAINIRKYLQ